MVTSMTKKRIVVVAVICIFAVGVCLMNVFFMSHTLSFEQVDEVRYKNVPTGLGEDYFFIKDSRFSCFYDGEEFLKSCVPDYDTSKLKPQEYTYLITVDRKAKAVTYSGRKCLMRTYFAFPEEYVANIECEETNDGILRIYRMKKINIDYDYHSS